MKYIIPLFFAFACSGTFAGRLTIVPDSTSSVGIKQQRQQAHAYGQAAQYGPGQVRQRPVITRCSSSGDYQVSYTNCRDSTGGRSNITTYDGNSTGIYRPGNR